SLPDLAAGHHTMTTLQSEQEGNPCCALERGRLAMGYIGRADFNYRVIVWGSRDSIYSEPAGVDDRDMAQACFQIACKKWPNALITLQQGARVIEKSR